jgi:two-component system, sensor histidine kinase and response regulator
LVKILIIDDDDLLVEVITLMIREEGYQVIQASNGTEGVKIAQETFPDIIICDILMEQGDGYFVLAELQKTPATSTIPFIFLTCKTSRLDVRLGMKLGASDYLTKPFTRLELLSTIDAQLIKNDNLLQLTDDKIAKLHKNISHAFPREMRTPLTSIIGLSQIINRRCENITPEELRMMSSSIHTAGKRVYRTIGNFLLYTELELTYHDKESPALVQNKSIPNVVYFIKDSARELAKEANRSDDIVLMVSDGAPRIHKNYLKKIIEELLDNSFKFSKAGTSVILKTELTEDYYSLSVIDEGSGMSPESVSQIGAYMQFERKTHEQQGTGLGLVIVKRLIDLHGGTMQVNSIKDVGTTVKVSIPDGDQYVDIKN